MFDSILVSSTPGWQVYWRVQLLRRQFSFDLSLKMINKPSDSTKTTCEVEGSLPAIFCLLLFVKWEILLPRLIHYDLFQGEQGEVGAPGPKGEVSGIHIITYRLLQSCPLFVNYS